MTRQRLTKRQIKEDPLVTYVGRARGLATRYMRHLIIGAALVVVVIGSLMAMRNARRSAEAAAATQLSQAQYHLWGQNLPQAIDLADDILQRWPGTKSAHMANLVRADALLGSGETEEALEAYQAFLSREKHVGLLRTAGLRGAATALDDLGRFGEAAARYEELARSTDHGPLVAADLISAARCRAQEGDIAGARALYQEVLDDYPDVQTGVDVRLRLLELDQVAGGQT